MDCPYCSSNNTRQVGTNPYTGMNKYTCDNCSADFVGKPSSIITCAKPIDKDSFTYGIPSSQLKDCPACGKRACYWIGGGPGDIECADSDCKFYKKYSKDNRYKYASDKRYEDTNAEEKAAKDYIDKEVIIPKEEVDPDADTKDMDPMDFTGMFP